MKDKRFVAIAYVIEKQFTLPYEMRGYGMMRTKQSTP